MIDGNKGHKQIRTLVKSLDEVRRWYRGTESEWASSRTPPHPCLLAQVLDSASSPRGT